jgi:hypothetical protein
VEATEPAGPVLERRKRRWVLPVALVVVTLLGLGGVGGGAFTLNRELTRTPTQVEIDAASVAEVAQRWRRLTAAEIFPATIPYSAEYSADDLDAHRIGIVAPQACGLAFDAKAATVLTRHHCSVTLRATYQDGSGTMVATVGIAVFPDTATASAAQAELSGAIDSNKVGIRAVGFADTAAGTFGDGQRQRWSEEFNNEPYLYFATAGWADGRATLPVAQQTEDFAFYSNLLTQVALTLRSSLDPCTAKGIRC